MATNPDLQKIVNALEQCVRVADTAGEYVIDTNLIADTFSAPPSGKSGNVLKCFEAQGDGTFKLNMTA